ncbi:MAG TPA: kelch repeat-containing protein, partial [Streptosporangiaceae bacterium]|nr:kelch repeat-containing protein [Streptosporangiaceae bacterium]
WSATSAPHADRSQQTATLLPDGKVLVAGGVDNSAATFKALPSAELYNPSTGTWSTTGSMSVAREGQNATLLANGQVLVTAGVQAVAGPFAELYNPATGTWTAASSGLAACTTTRACLINSSATLLANGQVLVAGGIAGLDSRSGSTTAAELYNPSAGTWSTTGSLNTARGNQTATLLSSGKVLVAGGVDFASHSPADLASAELYTP